MNCYTRQHKQYCGIALPAKARSGGILEQHGTQLVHKNLPTTPDACLRSIAPEREARVVGGEGMVPWYGLAARGAKAGRAWVLGQALSMTALHGGKAPNDKLEAGQVPQFL